MVCVHHFTPSNHPDISRVRSLRGAESIKLAYGIIKKNVSKIFYVADFFNLASKRQAKPYLYPRTPLI